MWRHHVLYCFCIHVCVKLSSTFNYKSTATRLTFDLIVSVLMSILRGVTKAYSWLHPWDLGMHLLLWSCTWVLLNKDLEDRKLNNARLICVPGKSKTVLMNHKWSLKTHMGIQSGLVSAGLLMSYGEFLLCFPLPYLSQNPHFNW